MSQVRVWVAKSHLDVRDPEIQTGDDIVKTKTGGSHNNQIPYWYNVLLVPTYLGIYCVLRPDLVCVISLPCICWAATEPANQVASGWHSYPSRQTQLELVEGPEDRLF